MKNTFKKIAAIALAVLMCVSAMVPAFAADATCPGTGKTHTEYNCNYVEAGRQEATCTADGFVTGKCTTCGTVFSVSQTEALGHTWGDVVSTCGATPARTCEVCKVTETVGALVEHLYTAWEITGGVCGTPNEMVTRTCVYCGDVEEDYVSVDGHYWAIVSYVKYATCGEYGEANFECLVKGCGAKKTAEITPDVSAHVYVDWTDASAKEFTKGQKDPNFVEAKCDKTGRYSVVCALCGDTQIKVTPVAAHTYGALVAKVEPKCEKNGMEAYYQCKMCRTYFDETYTEVEKDELVILANHKNPAALTIVKEKLPTCVADGYRTWSCTVCTDYTNKKEVLPKLGGHLYYADVKTEEQKIAVLSALEGMSAEDFDELYTSKQVAVKWAALGKLVVGGTTAAYKDYTVATCEENASVKWLCLNYMENASGAYVSCCNLDDAKIKATTLTGEKYDALGHDYRDDMTSTDYVAAECETAGYMPEKCATCGEYGAGYEIAALGHDYVTVTKADVKSGKYAFTYEDETGATVAVVPEVFATCQSNGTSFQLCLNEYYGYAPSYDETKVLVEFDVNADGTSHVWDYTNTTVATVEALKCGETIAVERYCTEDNCSEANPKNVNISGPAHDYADTKNEKVLKDLVDIIETMPVDKNTALPVVGGYSVKYIQKANCEQGARFQLLCNNAGCNSFITFDLTEGYAGGHDKVYFENTSAAATCTTDGHSNYWYCLNENCEYYVDEEAVAGADEVVDIFEAIAYVGGDLASDVTYPANHKVWDAKNKKSVNVTYKNVADERVSGAKKLDDAKLVEADGVNYVSVEGTTLVWVFVTEAQNHTELDVALGGFYCVECDNHYDSDITVKADINSRGTLCSSYENSNTTADCDSIGYDAYTCDDCYASYVAKLNDADGHDYVYIVEKTGKFDSANIGAWDLTDPTTGDYLYREARTYVKATCTNAGYMIDVCTKCNVSKVASIAAHGHWTGDAAGKGEDIIASCLDTTATRRCGICAVKVPADHVYVNGACTDCGAAQ